MQQCNAILTLDKGMVIHAKDIIITVRWSQTLTTPNKGMAAQIGGDIHRIVLLPNQILTTK